MQNINITVTAASGVESVTKNELIKLGYGNPQAINGAITFGGELTDVARCNMFLRTADRVYINLKTFVATTFDELFEGVSSIRFEDYITSVGKILVDGKCVKSKLYAVSASQSVVKKAIVERLKKAYRVNTLPESGETYNVEFWIFKDVVSVLLNTSGVSLHKRGYRDKVGKAPIKETLASAILLLSDFYYKRPLVDPFCGSGTIIIEGARIALNVAPGINRSFDYQNWKKFDKTLYQKVFEEAKDLETLDKKLYFHGYDIDPKAVKLARYHAQKAGISDHVEFAVKDVKDFECDRKNGCIVTNPPYGERLLEREEVLKLYKLLGEKFRLLDNWSLFLITAEKEFERAFGKKADKNRKLYNSNKECKLYSYFYDRKLARDG